MGRAANWLSVHDRSQILRCFEAAGENLHWQKMINIIGPTCPVS